MIAAAPRPRRVREVERDGIVNIVRRGLETEMRSMAWRIVCVVVAAAIPAGSARSAGAEGLKAFHRSGQTFVTWKEDASIDGEVYHVLTSDAPIAAPGAKDAKVVARVPEGSGQFRLVRSKLRGLSGPEFRKRWPWLDGLWIEDVDKGGECLPAGTGLFVRTAKADGKIYLAVRTVHAGKTVATDVLSEPVAEKVAPPQAIHIAAAPKKGTVGGTYLLYMDFDEWNPDGVDDNWDGYAYPFNISCMTADVPKPLPVSVRLHAYTAWQDMDWPRNYPGKGSIRLAPLDQHCTWWYGFNDALPAKKPRGREPAPGKQVVNYTEKQALAIIEWLKRGPSNFPGRADPNQISVWGGSMGGSGANVFGMRYGKVFAASKGVVGYTSWGLEPRYSNWYENVQAKWGAYQDNPKTNEGPGVYDLLNMPKWFGADPRVETPFLDLANNITDSVIPFHSFADYVRALEKAKRPFVAAWGLGGHFGGARSASRMDYGLMRLDESLPALANASCRSRLVSGFRILGMSPRANWTGLTAKTLTIKAGTITDRIGVNEKGCFPKGMAGKVLILGPCVKTQTWWTIKSNTPTELTIAEGNLLEYQPKIPPYTLHVWKLKNNKPNPTEDELAKLRASCKKRFAICDGDPRGTINGHFAWSSSGQNFDPKRTADDIVDTPDRWAVCLRLVPSGVGGEWGQDTATVDVTPRRTQRFKPAAGEKVQWVNYDCSSPEQMKKVDAGEVVADRYGLVTVPKVVVGKAGWGHRLVLTRKGG